MKKKDIIYSALFYQEKKPEHSFKTNKVQAFLRVSSQIYELCNHHENETEIPHHSVKLI